MCDIVEEEEEKSVASLQRESREKEAIASETQLANFLYVVVDDHLYQQLIHLC